MSTLRISRQWGKNIIEEDYPNPIMEVAGEERRKEEKKIRERKDKMERESQPKTN